jgi:hypothetical protein
MRPGSRPQRGRLPVSELAKAEGLTHSNEQTTERYLRRRVKKIVAIAEARKQARPAETKDGTASEPPVRITSESQGKS